ncbi:DUF3223 domain-containing protein [Ramlibacter sp. RBP-2]|uniref:DUF3223 domain-containing protein n=1 Tax=Ramlibacter lithotrophicus TaxID=2606681 RepID=A0A7X6I8V5_9BURK|nr:DCL family protein [Ramlibacter lithotrophicus]NKE68694.1 DUF3223 domain-containing protein [Ramlibacter lithotrophicus]
MTKTVSLPNGRTWRPQSAALDHFKDMLNRYADGQRVTDQQDHDDLAALLSVYDAVPGLSETKTGVGVDYFYRDLDREPRPGGVKTSCFYVMRQDGTAVDFSAIKAVRVASA